LPCQEDRRSRPSINLNLKDFMRARSVLRAAVLLALVPSAMPAQSVGRMLETDFRNFGGDVWAVWTSPFRAGPKDWLTAGAVVGASAAFMPLDDDVDRWMVRNQSNGAWGAIRELREGGIAFSGKYITPVAAGALVYGLATKNTKIQEGIFGCLASYASGSVVRNYVLYNLVGRERPDSARDDAINSAPAEEGDQYNFTFPGKKEWGMHSMPAGHAANIMSCASFLGNRFEMGYVEPVLYAVTAGIGVGRLVDRRHWTSDTFVGMAFGYAIGRQVATRSLKRAEKAGVGMGAASSALSNTYFSPSKTGVTLGWRTTF
jgi:membrane-associated phospholipid phosphatase